MINTAKILELYALGKNKNQIAKQLGISWDTVNRHIIKSWDTVNRHILKERENERAKIHATILGLKSEKPKGLVLGNKKKPVSTVLVMDTPKYNGPKVHWVHSTVPGTHKGYITMYSDKVYTVNSGHTKFNVILKALKDGNHALALELASVENHILRQVKFNSGLIIDGDKITYKGRLLRGGAASRIIDDMMLGKDFSKWASFLSKLLENPEEKNIVRLFDFLVHKDIEICDDGHFYAWKYVRKDFTDCFTGTIDNSPGKSPRMPREEVCNDDNISCAPGLHVCALKYMEGINRHSYNIVLVKVHPRDVVSIPLDYNVDKIRTCGYHVMERR
ncbi:lysis inhibitor [Shewanella phage Thanatos-2]|nr:lysis inhibitor [Shewanella phage Thanatos-2]